MFLTIESARFPCCTTLFRLPCSISAISLISVRSLLSRCAPASASRNSSMSSTEMAEKLLTKLSGFLISCAIPAVNWPSEASFSVWTSRACAAFNSRSAASAASLAARTFALCDVAVDRYEPASRHRIDAYFQHAAVGSRPFYSPLTIRAFDIAMQFRIQIDILELAVLDQIGDIVAVGAGLGEK